MKTFFAATLALSMLAAPAIAAPRDNHSGAQAQHQAQQKANRLDNRQHQAQNRANNRANNRAQAHRQYFYNGRHFNAVRGPAWHAPRGYDAHRVWNRGDYLHSSYRTRSYVIDYRAYGLMRPAYGYEWVRVNNNVMLVNARNGFISQIVFSMFY